ncbi:MAG: bifunctional phosphoribosylaminoimidazolecarboxamide formyltransferase/inosine monophosphate cyclohydrolase [Candidatus Diapherotrites archaeon]|uniref:Bifunctional phosphoribosylaminoimidazolecarboxamide formyltransferase/inosine monophosphate cyclohydrolase n=1 Tax=Candidatus Iainarchaeum sp. TaxID=3101447 RepID=A0A2D6M186_9ARCH|nr:bifunctional phosphoribosylaminoimidazolecarboxamide formyltransferase/inosine monophosphate cyclohydrolase [Candidatus Diapherotrites archaeon]
MSEKKKRALISVSDKKGLKELVKALDKHGFEIISTGGTAKAIEKVGVKVTPVEKVTNFKEMLDGRVKTLHPKLHAGILALRDSKKHMQQLKETNIMLIDLVVVNLYPFRRTVSKKAPLDEIIENIDIGGPTLIRAAAKNFHDVAVVVKPTQYQLLIDELDKNNGVISLKTRQLLAAKAFEHTAYYDTTINDFLHRKFNPDEFFPDDFSVNYRKVMDLRYGENPDQKAALYKESFIYAPSIARAKVLNGKQLSFNNIIDANDAIGVVQEFEQPAACLIKHNNACGAAVAAGISEAFQKGHECDPKSAYGSIIALNRECDVETAKKIIGFFNEVVIAPSYDEAALKILSKKQNLRVLQLKALDQHIIPQGLDYKKIEGGLLAQSVDIISDEEADLTVVSKKKPTEEQVKDMLFAWRIVKHVKSNAIVLAKNRATVGIGAGQMSRVDAVEIAVRKAGGREKGAVLASDGFFPFRDNIDIAAEKGITAIIEPGGSMHDQKIIDAANEKGIVLVFTGVRHFKH